MTRDIGIQTEGHRQFEAYRWRDRQRDRQIGGWTDRQIGTVVEEWTDQWRDRLAQIRLTNTDRETDH